MFMETLFAIVGRFSGNDHEIEALPKLECLAKIWRLFLEDYGLWEEFQRKVEVIYN